jgi:hypothetical protein
VSSGLGGELFSAKRAGIQNTKSKFLKKFSPFLTPYFTISYVLHYPLYATRCTLFFEPNAQLRPFIERRSFSALSLPVVSLSNQSKGLRLLILFRI